MSNDLKPFLMVINDETGDFVDIEMIQAVVIADGMSNIVLNNDSVVISPLKPRELWSRINVIRHKYGQSRRLNPSGSTTPSKEPLPARSMDQSNSIPSDKQ